MSFPSASGLWAMRFLWDHYSDRHNFIPSNKEQWISEFFFCLLGGYSIPYELNLSAFLVLREKGYFDPSKDWGDLECLSNLLNMELESSQFEPKKKNGEYRAYRFPKLKARVVAQAREWLKQSCKFDISRLLTNDPRQDREILLHCPGLGYKTASWYLRNIGFGNNLAILDVHVCRTLKDFKIIPTGLDLPSDYLRIEDSFCDACDQIGAKADAMDLIIWDWARGGSQ